MPRKRKRKPLIPAWLDSAIIRWQHWKKAALLGAPFALGRLFTRFWRLWAAGTLALAAGAYADSAEVGWVLFAVALTALAYLRLRKPAKRSARWWDQETLASAFVAAGILSASGDKLPDVFGKGKMFSRRGQPVHNEHGTTVQVSLPQAKTLDDVLKLRGRLASALDVPKNRLTISQEPDDSGRVVRIHVGAAKRKGPVPPPVVDAVSTDWSRPIRLGVDDRGREVTFATTETHSVFAGATGSGKTALAKLVVSHAALDPRVRLYGIDGKGDAGAKGWQPLQPLCEAFVRGMGPDSPARVEALLEEVYTLAEQRGGAGDEAPEVALILEEWATARTVLRRLDPAAADRCDALVTVLLATARSRGVHCILIVQRGTATAFPVDQRANCGQRVVGKFGDRAEAGYVLESLPARLPEQAGEFALSLDGKAPALLTADYLTDEAWRKVCKRAAALRAPARPPLTLAPPPTSPQAPGEGLVDEVVAILSTEGQLSATELHGSLPPSLREGVGTARDLGVLLAAYPSRVERVKAGNGRAWRLAEGADLSAGVW